MTRIFYISQINLLSSRTNAHNLAKTCEALNDRDGFQVSLITTDQEHGRDSFFKKLGVERPYEVVSLGVTDSFSRQSGSMLGTIFRLLCVNARVAYFLFRSRREFDIIYYRDDLLFFSALFSKLFLGKKLFFETHAVLSNKHRQFMNVSAVRSASGVIAISSGLKEYYQKLNGNIIVSLCSAADKSWFDASADQQTLRLTLGIPSDKFIIGYVGVVGANPNNDYYEIDDIVLSLVYLPSDILLFIGGELGNNADWLRKVAEENNVRDRVTILPWLERDAVPNYLQAFDVNLIPRRKKDLIGDSPAKMFPALESGRAIVAGRSESIKEVLTDGRDALVVRDNTPQGWAEAILKVYHDGELARRLSSQAKITSRVYTWEKRGIAIAGFIKQTLNASKI